MFYTYGVHEGKNYKVMIDGLSPRQPLRRFKAEPHPQPYNVTWVDKMTQLLPSIVICLSAYLATKIEFGVTFRHGHCTHLVW